MATFDAQTVGCDVSPSYTPTLQIDNNLITVELGDGYKQRLSKGIHPSIRTWTLPFNNRSNTDTTHILNFLSSATGGNNGARAFNWTPPYGLTGKWTCENPRVVNKAFNLNDINLEFKEVFEP